MKKLGVMLLAAAFSLPVFAAKQAAQQPTTMEQGSKPPAKAKTHKAHSKKHSKKKASTASTTTSTTGTPAPAKK